MKTHVCPWRILHMLYGTWLCWMIFITVFTFELPSLSVCRPMEARGGLSHCCSSDNVHLFFFPREFSHCSGTHRVGPPLFTTGAGIAMCTSRWLTRVLSNKLRCTLPCWAVFLWSPLTNTDLNSWLVFEFRVVPCYPSVQCLSVVFYGSCSV